MDFRSAQCTGRALLAASALLLVGGCGSDVEPAGIIVAQAGAAAGGSAGASGAGAGSSAGGAGSASSAGGASGGAAGSPAGAQGTSDLPCAVVDVLRTHCHECHGFPVRGGAPVTFYTREVLLAPSRRDPAQRYVERIVARMKDDAAPMPLPPRPRVSAAEIAGVQAWIDQGTPAATCEYGGPPLAPGGTAMQPPATPGSDPLFDAPATCTSGDYWDDGDDGSRRMHPGRACITCHDQQDDEDTPSFAIGGTVFPTAHEPDECYGVDGEEDTDMFVVITGADGRELRLPVNDAGNFHSDEEGGDDIVFPIRAKVVRGDRERVMAGERMTGDCNACHTQNGENGAPGRIVAP